MSPLDLHSERYAATGNIEAHGARNQLGRPRLDQLTVLAREAFQNSWDARTNPAGGVVCGLDLWTATPEQRDFLRNTVFAQTPARLPFDTVLQSDVPLLAISDRGTSGLGGPDRADVIPDDGDTTDFVDLLRNIGQPPDKPLGGGTFGYGKAALYAPSAVNTILVYTRARVGGRLLSRLIGACLGTGFTLANGPERGRYTGRHWWGRLDGDLAEPLLDADADACAAGLGLATFAPEETGTTILVVGFQPGPERTMADGVRLLSSAILWNFWPKMVAVDGVVPMTFRFSWEGREHPLPQPERTPPLALFVRALEKARAKQAVSDLESVVQEVTSRQPRRSLGWLALVKGLRGERSSDLDPDPATGGFDQRNSSHIACMRQAELVVKYLPAPPLEIDVVEYAGVFLASDNAEIDRAFAQSEPPTHDDWIPANMPTSRQKALVRSALRTVGEAALAFATPDSGRRDEARHAPLGRLSSVLGSILVGLEGPGGEVPVPTAERTRSQPVIEVEPETGDEAGASTGEAGSEGASDPEGAIGSDRPAGPDEPPAPARPPGRPAVRLSQPRLAVEDGDIGVLQIDVDVRHGVRTRGTRLRVTSGVILDGGEQEREPPAGAATPRPLRWRGPARVVEEPGDSLDLGLDDAGRWTLSVRLIDDAEIRVSVVGEALT